MRALGIFLAVLGAVLAPVAPLPRPALAIEAVSHGCAICGHPPAHPWHYRSCTYYGRGLDEAPSSSSSGGGLSAADQAALSAMAPLFQQLGQELGKSLWGAPSPDPRLRQEEETRARERDIEEAKRRTEEERLRAEEAAREREARRRRLQGVLKSLPGEGSGGPRFKDLPDEGLRPQGTPFFGLGGGKGAEPPASDPMVVDLRNLRMGSYLARSAETAPPADREFLLEEALRAAQGEAVDLRPPPRGAVPEIPKEGLRDFQEAQAEFRKAHDSRYILAARFNAAQRRMGLADRIADAARKEAAGAPGLSEMFAALRTEREAWWKAKALLDQGLAEEAYARVQAREAVRRAGVPSPAPPRGVLAGERKRLDPGFDGRLRHEALRRYAKADAEEADAYYREAYRPVEDPAAEARLRGVVQRLRAVSPYPEEALEVRLLGRPWASDAPPLTAKASSHALYVGEDFLKSLPPSADDELAFLVGHEVAHVQGDHYATSLLRNQAEGAREWTERLVDPDQTTLPPEDRGWIRGQVRRTRMAGFSLGQETEADRLGAVMALSAGAKPEGVRKAFERMRAGELAWKAGLPGAEARRVALTRDHPEPEARFEALRGIYGKALGDALGR